MKIKFGVKMAQTQTHYPLSFRGSSIPFENSMNAPNVNQSLLYSSIFSNFLLFLFNFCVFLLAMMNQTRQQTKYCLGLASQSSKKGNNSNYINNNNNNNNNNSNNYNYSNYNNSNGNEEDDAAFEKMRKDIEANQDNALSLCTEKVLLAQQAYDLVPFFFLFKMPLGILILFIFLSFFYMKLCFICCTWCKWLMGFNSWSFNVLFDVLRMSLVHDTVRFCFSSMICSNIGIWGWTRNHRWTMLFWHWRLLGLNF